MSINWSRRRFVQRVGAGLMTAALPFPLTAHSNLYQMIFENKFDVIIVGGSYSGLAAAMALGRALKNVLVIDDGKPCNRQTPHSHNFLTNDGKTPAEIAALANAQVSRYETIKFFKGFAKSGMKTDMGFEIQVSTGEIFVAEKLIFATGIKDVLPDIDGLSACWGISALHCPYCHGYEVRNEKTGILGNGDAGFDFARLISNWTKDLTLYSNGRATFTSEQISKLEKHQINVIEKKIERFEHNHGHIEHIVFTDGSKSSIKAIYASSPFVQHCKIPELLGCALTEEGYIKIDHFQETTIKGVYAIGDNAAKMRTVANAVATGTTAGITVSKKLILETF